PAPRPAASKPAAPAAPPPARPARDIPEGEPIRMPFGDLTVSEGRLVRWLKKPGDPVEIAELVAEIETDKAVVEIESPSKGVIGTLMVEPGEVVRMGETIAVVAARGA
ncbi:dehydrogenase, partial [Alsobacter sp. SYSU M60028]